MAGFQVSINGRFWASTEVAPVATADDARLLEWELRVASVDDIALAAANAARAGYEIDAAGDDRLITDPSGITIRLTT